MWLLRLGIHLYTFGSLGGAARRAAEIGADTLQIFTASPRMWRFTTPSPMEIAELKRVRAEHRLNPLVIHVNYLVNLASRDPVIRPKSIATLRAELDRAALVGAEYLVVHPGSCRGQTMEESVTAAAEAIRDAAEGFDSTGVTLLLENTAGSGSHLGSKFEELRGIRDQAVASTALPIGYCLDTCHLFAAGFDITTEEGLRATLRDARRILGWPNIVVIHANDSKGAFGSRVDRHAKIGEGKIGREAFRRILAARELRAKVIISETPVEQDGDERRNMETLRKLVT